MIRLDDESAAPEVRAPVPYGVDEADELPLIGGEGAMAWRDGAAKERNRVRVLDQHCAKPVRRSGAFHDEVLGEVRHRQDRGRGDCRLERIEGHDCCVGPGEPFLRRAVSSAATEPKLWTNLR